MSDDGDLKLTAGSRTISGWTEVRLTRGCETCPNSFEIGMTDLDPDDASIVVVREGDPCVVEIGDDKVITGYVDRVIPEITPTSHQIRVMGRGKCQDLIDCSAEWEHGTEINLTSALDVATKLASPYGITVKSLGGAGPAIPQFNFFLGQSAYEIIERCARFCQFLAYEDPDGNLLLAQVGTDTAASGFSEGENVEIASLTSAMDGRFSEYQCFLVSTDPMLELGENHPGNLFGSAKDPNVLRHRLKYLIAEPGQAGQDNCQKRAAWEAARNAGRGRQARITADSWRDAKGKLWTPNTLAPLKLPSLKLPSVSWVIGEVTYRRDASGTHSDLLLMPPEAFNPEPIVLEPINADQLPKR